MSPTLHERSGISPILRRWARPTRVLASLALLAAPVPAAALDVISCLLEPSRSFSIGAAVAGIVTEVPVSRGDRVREGDVLLRIDASVERAQLAAARFTAESDAVIESRRAQLEIATSLFEQAQALADRGVATRNQLEEATAQKLVAEAQLREALEAQEAARLQVRSVEAALAQRVLRAPADAVVLERLADVGELAGTGAPLLELVSVEELHAEVLAPASQYDTVALGQGWEVSVENSAVLRRGEVTAIDPVIDAASRTFGFRLTLPNEDFALTAGNRCDLVQP